MSRLRGHASSVPRHRLLRAGCLEQLQTTRIASGALSNFLLHLQAGELDDARAYFAPGLVTPSAQLDESLQEAYKKLHDYEIRDKKSIAGITRLVIFQDIMMTAVGPLEMGPITPSSRYKLHLLYVSFRPITR